MMGNFSRFHTTLTSGANWESSIFIGKIVLGFKITHLEMSLWKVNPSNVRDF